MLNPGISIGNAILTYLESPLTPPPISSILPSLPCLPPFLRLLRPLLLLLPALSNPLQDILPILIQLQLDDLHLARVNANRHSLPVRLVFRDALDVDDVFETVDGCDFAFAAFVAAACD